MGLTDRLNAWITGTPARSYGLAEYLQYVNFAGNQYLVPNLNQTIRGHAEEIEDSFRGLVAGAYKANGIVFACMLARLQLFSEARFQYQHMRKGRPADLWSDDSLRILDHPWIGGTTGDLLSRAIQDADLSGNAFLTRRNGAIRRMRPDWVTIMLGSQSDPEVQGGDIDAEVLGYLFHPGGKYSGRPVEVLQRSEVAHFAPNPDPIATYRGMSWLTPVIREIMADGAATDHKIAFFANGATPNMVVSLDPAITKEKFDAWRETFERNHVGAENAYRTLYLGGGADVKVVGGDLKQLDFKMVQGAGETRIAAAAGVPPIVVGLSEGLQAATYSNYGQARRRFADNTMRPLWRNIAGSLETIVPPPGGSRLWYDDRDIQALAEDKKDLAEVHQLEAQQIRTLTDAGYTPESIISAVMAGDFTLLVHTGLYSVQLQPPQPDGPPAPPPVVVEPPKRDEALWALVALAERAAARDVLPPTVTISEGAIQLSSPVTISEGAISTTVESPPMVISEDAVRMTQNLRTRTVIDRDPETNAILGTHEEPL